jgi:thiosulfate reductase cytochrome b subunit
MKRNVKLFTGFERFWHWTQALLIFGLLITGFGMHGLHGLFEFGEAMDYHLILAWTLIGLWVFAIFWHLTTGQWRQYVPTNKGLTAMIMYYAYGIFSGEPKPFATSVSAKHNPLQRLAYLGFKLLIAPALWISGLLLMFYSSWKGTALGESVELMWVAWVHVAAAYGLVVFLIGHVYMAVTTGDPWYAYLKAMVTGYEKVEVRDTEAG